MTNRAPELAQVSPCGSPRRCSRAIITHDNPNCFGPRTAAAGFVGTTWPVTSQLNIMRIAASCCLTDGAETSNWSSSM